MGNKDGSGLGAGVIVAAVTGIPTCVVRGTTSDVTYGKKSSSPTFVETAVAPGLGNTSTGGAGLNSMHAPRELVAQAALMIATADIDAMSKKKDCFIRKLSWVQVIPNGERIHCVLTVETTVRRPKEDAF